VLPDLSVLWVILFVLLTTVALNSLLFKPLLRVMRQRDETIASARAVADKAAAEATRAAAEFDTKTAAARAEVYREMDETRRVAQNQRAELVAATRAETDVQLAEARSRLTAETDQARARLEADADALGTVIAERVLGRKIS